MNKLVIVSIVLLLAGMGFSSRTSWIMRLPKQYILSANRMLGKLLRIMCSGG